MIHAILFIMACLALQALKDSFRRPEVPIVKLKQPKIIRAKCGCKTEEGERVVEPCAAHRVMLGL